MPARRLLALTALSLLAMSNSCKKEEDTTLCKTSLEVATSRLAVPGAILEPVPNVGQSNHYVINSVAEYQEVFTGPLPTVDFTAYTLLAGKTRLATSGRVLTQRVSQTCSGYTYAVQLAADSCHEVSNVTYCVLIPKLLPETKVAFDAQLPVALPTPSLTQSATPDNVR